MNVAPGNSGFEAQDRRGPSGLPAPATPRARDLRLRMTTYFDGEMGPAERAEAEAQLAQDPRAAAVFGATRRAVDALAVTQPSPDLTSNILDELDRRRRLMGTHRHARRRLMIGLATAAGSVALLGVVFVVMDAVLPPLSPPLARSDAGSTDPAGRPPLESLIAGPAPTLSPADGRHAHASTPLLTLESPTDATSQLRWDVNGSPLVGGAPVDSRVAAGILPLDPALWPATGSAGLWTNPFSNASMTQSPTILLGLDELELTDPLNPLDPLATRAVTATPLAKPKPAPKTMAKPADKATEKTAEKTAEPKR